MILSDISLFTKQHTDKKIVVAGGCFDKLHAGHRKFLCAAKKQGDILVVLLESDKRITQLKGKNRPFQDQQQRSHELEKLSYVDSVLLLPYFSANDEYDVLISQLKPAIIATTSGDPFRFHKERQAALVGAIVVDVIHLIPDISTSILSKKRKI